jgi:RNA polymerase sigma factor (sigma-70 family)
VLHAEVNTLIERLTPDQQTVIRMRFQQQMPIEAVARYLDRSPAAVKALQARGIQTLGILIGAESN